MQTVLVSSPPVAHRSAVAVTLLSALLFGSDLVAQEPGAAENAVAFEVASIRLDLATDHLPVYSVRVLPGDRTFQAEAYLSQIAEYGYGLQFPQRVEGSQALLKERFVIVATIPERVKVTDEAVRQMVRTLLSERFKLRVRLENEMQTVSVLKRVRGDRLGPKLRARTDGCATGPGDQSQSTDSRVKARCSLSMTNGHMTGSVESMAWFAQFLSGFGRRVILDGTELRGSYDVEMTFDPGTFTPSLRPSTAEPTALPTFTEALRDSLGLSLETLQRPVSKLVVEYVERPTDN